MDVMSRKAEGLSLQTIIIAIISLVVLVVIILILTGKIGRFTESVSRCEGTCEESCELNERIVPGTSCAEGSKCCVDVFDSDSDDAA